jgi:hypothetical protein
MRQGGQGSLFIPGQDRVVSFILQCTIVFLFFIVIVLLIVFIDILLYLKVRFSRQVAAVECGYTKPFTRAELQIKQRST